MKKVSAVEWLVEQILQKVQNYEDDDIETEEEPFIIEYVNRYNFNVDLTKFVEQAKEMEKEQMERIYYGHNQYNDKHLDFEQYYKETFKSE